MKKILLITTLAMTSRGPAGKSGEFSHFAPTTLKY
jgi:hypothetical protein